MKRKKFEVRDRVVMDKYTSPTSKFRTGIVKAVDGSYPYGSIRVKRDGYKGHEYTWWPMDDWERIE